MARRQRRPSSRRSLRHSPRDRPVVTHRAVAVVQARMTSTRLPGKVMLPLAGRPLLVRVMERVARTPGLAGVCLAIPTGKVHRPLADLARAEGWMLAEGPEDD